MVSSTERLVDDHRLEASFERGVLLDILAILVERRRADSTQLPAREHRLEQVRGVHRALGRAGTDDRVQFVDEQDHRPGASRISSGRLQPLLELAAKLRARD